MRFFLLFLILMQGTVFGTTHIKIGVFKNIKNLRANIAKIRPYSYQKKIVIKKKRGLYYAYALLLGNGTQTNKALSVYRRIFDDAFIAANTKATPKRAKIRRFKSQKPKTKRELSAQKRDPTPIPHATSTPLNASSLLQDKSIYLCYENGPSHLKGRVVKMDFHDGNITYTPLTKRETLEIPYRLEQNRVILQLFETEMIHELIANQGEYLRVQSHIGTKEMYYLRYYFAREDALAYIYNE